MSYKILLKNPHWQKKRLEILQRDAWKCQFCNSGLHNDETLNVHHKYYEDGRAPWEYPDAALITICEDCHNKLHSPHAPQDFRTLTREDYTIIKDLFLEVLGQNGTAKKIKRISIKESLNALRSVPEKPLTKQSI